MLERDGFPPGVPCWIDTAQPDPQAAAGFYGQPVRLGVRGPDAGRRPRPLPRGPAPGPGRGRRRIGARRSAPPAPAWNTYIWVDSADDTAAKVTDAGGTVLSGPFDVLDAGRMAVCADPSGAVFCLWQAGHPPGGRRR